MTDIPRAELKYLVERQREELHTLSEAGKLLSATADPQEVIRLVANYLKQTFPVALCVVLSLKPRTRYTIRFAAITDAALEMATRDLYAKAGELLRQSLTFEGENEVLAELSQPTEASAHTPISFLQSGHVIALRFKEDVIAILSVFSGKANAFSKDDQRVMAIVADQAGAALHTALLLEELRQTDQIKNELLMLISHELHTPLTSIREGTNLVLDGALGPTTQEQHEFLKTINESATRLDRLVEKTLLATQLLTGRLGYKFEALDLCAILKEIEKKLLPDAKQKQVQMEFAGLGTTVKAYGDTKQLRHAVHQIVENAIHATRPGGLITIACAQAGQEAEVVVTDTGSGIPAKSLANIFKQFCFTGTIDDRKTGGLGLGLFTAKGIIEAHRGRISLESQAGLGTKAIIRLPSQPPA